MMVVECTLYFIYHINGKGEHMVSRLGLKVGKWLYDHGHIDEIQIEVVRYAVEIVCSEFTEFLFIVIYGICTEQLTETILYILLFQVLRKNFKGFHATTIFKCFILTLGSYLIIMYSYIHMNLPLIVFSLIVSSALQVEYCIRNKEVKSILVSALFWVIAFAIYVFVHDYSTLQMLAIIELIVSISLIPERRNYSYE